MLPAFIDGLEQFFQYILLLFHARFNATAFIHSQLRHDSSRSAGGNFLAFLMESFSIHLVKFYKINRTDERAFIVEPNILVIQVNFDAPDSFIGFVIAKDFFNKGIFRPNTTDNHLVNDILLMKVSPIGAKDKNVVRPDCKIIHQYLHVFRVHYTNKVLYDIPYNRIDGLINVSISATAFAAFQKLQFKIHILFLLIIRIQLYTSVNIPSTIKRS